MTARQLADRLASLLEPAMRRTVLREQLEKVPRGEAVMILDDFLRRGRQAEPPFDAALAALAAAMDGAEGSLSYAFRSEIYAAARDGGLDAVAGYFLSAHERPGEEPVVSERALLPGERPLTLGERKALARKPSGELLDRLARDPEPDVIRALLANSRLTEQDVIVIASLRPQRPANLREVFRCPRWSSRYRVRRTLAFNPHTPGDVAVRVLVFLTSSDLREVTEDGNLDDAVRREAAALLRARHGEDSGKRP